LLRKNCTNVQQLIKIQTNEIIKKKLPDIKYEDLRYG